MKKKKKEKKNFGKIRWFDKKDLNELKKDDSFRYIIFVSKYTNIVLEEYSIFYPKWIKNKVFRIIKMFPPEYMNKESFRSTLEKCRELIGVSDVIWIEKPDWLKK